MAYNYAREKRKFDGEWKRKALWYRKEGMSEEDIEAMYRFDLAQFNRDRAYESRRRPLETACGSCYIQQPSERYSWIYEVSEPRLVEKLRRLSESDIELLGFPKQKQPTFWAASSMIFLVNLHEF